MASITRSPFPGMDPYLERPYLWPDVHNRLITTIANTLAPEVRARYYVAIEERVYIADPGSTLVGRPDVSVVDSEDEPPWPRIDEAVSPYRPFLINLPTTALDELRETYLEVREAAGGQVVTVIELLSPANKQRGSEGYIQYLNKRLNILRSQTHLVEIDLLRGQKPLPMEGNPPASDYHFIISRSWQRPQAHLYTFNLPEAIPNCPVPLQSEQENEPVLKLQNLLHTLYEQAGYDLRIDYRIEPVPPFSTSDATWADELLHAAGLRG